MNSKLITDWATTHPTEIILLGLLIAILTFLFGDSVLLRFPKFVFQLFKTLFSIFNNGAKPRKGTLHIVSDPRINFWGPSSNSEGASIQVDCKVMITNSYPSTDIRILKTVLGLTGGTGNAVVHYLRNTNERRGGAYSAIIAPIVPNETVQLELHFFEKSGAENEGKTITSDVFIYDQFDKEYKIKKVIFRPYPGVKVKCPDCDKILGDSSKPKMTRSLLLKHLVGNKRYGGHSLSQIEARTKIQLLLPE